MPHRKRKEICKLNKFYFGDNHVDEMFSGEHEDSQMRPSSLPDNPVVAMAYVPIQFYEDMYELEEGFHCGTIFPELSKPFIGCDRV